MTTSYFILIGSFKLLWRKYIYYQKRYHLHHSIDNRLFSSYFQAVFIIFVSIPKKTKADLLRNTIFRENT